MAIVTLKDLNNVFDKGSDLFAVGLTAAQAAAAFPAGHPAVGGGWIVIGHLEGGTISRSRDREEIKSEADVLVKTVVTRNEMVVSNTVFQTNADLLNFFDWYENNIVPARYPLPSEEQTATPNQWWFFASTNNRIIDWEIPTGNALRTRSFEILVTENGTDPLFEVAELPDDQMDSAWTPYSAFLDSVFPGA